MGKDSQDRHATQSSMLYFSIVISGFSSQVAQSAPINRICVSDNPEIKDHYQIQDIYLFRLAHRLV